MFKLFKKGNNKMNSRDWNIRGFKKHTNPSGEVIRTKTYWRGLIAYDNYPTRTVISQRKKLASLLQVPWYDLLADLEVIIKIERYPRHRRFLKYLPKI